MSTTLPLPRRSALSGFAPAALMIAWTLWATANGATGQRHPPDHLTRATLLSKLHVSASGACELWQHPSAKQHHTFVSLRIHGASQYSTDVPYLVDRTILLDDGRAVVSGFDTAGQRRIFDLCEARSFARSEVIGVIDTHGRFVEVYRHARTNLGESFIDSWPPFVPSIHSFAVLEGAQGIEVSVDAASVDRASSFRRLVVPLGPDAPAPGSPLAFEQQGPIAALVQLTSGAVVATWRMPSGVPAASSTTVVVMQAPQGSELFRATVNLPAGAANGVVRTLVAPGVRDGRSYVLFEAAAASILLEGADTDDGPVTVRAVARGDDALQRFSHLTGRGSTLPQVEVANYSAHPFLSPHGRSAGVLALRDDGCLVRLVPKHSVIEVFDEQGALKEELRYATPEPLDARDILAFACADDESYVVAIRSHDAVPGGVVTTLSRATAAGTLAPSGRYELRAEDRPDQVVFLGHGALMGLTKSRLYLRDEHGAATLFQSRCSPEDPLECLAFGASTAGQVLMILSGANDPDPESFGSEKLVVRLARGQVPMDAARLDIGHSAFRFAVAVGETTAAVLPRGDDCLGMSIGGRAETCIVRGGEQARLRLENVLCVGGDRYVGEDRSGRVLHWFTLQIRD